MNGARSSALAIALCSVILLVVAGFTQESLSRTLLTFSLFALIYAVITGWRIWLAYLPVVLAIGLTFTASTLLSENSMLLLGPWEAPLIRYTGEGVACFGLLGIMLRAGREVETYDEWPPNWWPFKRVDAS